MFVRVLTFAACALSFPPLAGAQMTRPGDLKDDVGIDQRLGEQVPGDLVFTDETGKQVRLGDYFGDKPILLSLVYFGCPGICGETMNEVLKSSQAIPLVLHADYKILTVSFDPKEGPALAAQKKRKYVELYARPGAEEGWHFLTGPEDSSRRLADAVGFRFRYIESSQQYAHSAGIMILTPEGKISKYFYGLNYFPRDLRLALVESSDGKIGTLADKVLLMCYSYDPMTGKYGFAVSTALKIGGALTVLLLGGFIGSSLLQERKQRRLEAAGAGSALDLQTSASDSQP